MFVRDFEKRFGVLTAISRRSTGVQEHAVDMLAGDGVGLIEAIG